MKNYPRLYVSDALKADGEITISEPHFHYLIKVMRLKSDDQVLLFNADDGEWLAEIKMASKKQGCFNVVKKLRAPVACHTKILYFAPLKRVAMDFVIEKGTELGVTHFKPVLTDYTQKTFYNVDKYRQTAIEAAEQCERFDIPNLDAPVKLAEALTAHEDDGQILWADESAGRAGKRTDTASQSKAILVGPEGGFSEAEQTMLRAHDKVTPCSLGPRILRAETAALVMLVRLV